MDLIREMEVDLDRDPLEDLLDNIATQINLICESDKEFERAIAVMESLSQHFWRLHEADGAETLAETVLRFTRERAAKANLAFQREERKRKETNDRERETERRVTGIKNSHEFKAAFAAASEGERRVLEDILPRYVWGQRTQFVVVAKDDSRSHVFNPRPKEWEDLSPCTREQYKVLEKKLAKKIDLSSASTWDVVRYLGEIAKTKNRSTYYRERSVLAKMAERERTDVWRAIRALPCLETLLEFLGGVPNRRSGERTRERRKKKNPEIFSSLLGLLSPNKRDAIEVMSMTGARVSEMASFRIERNGEWIAVEIETAKTGSRLLKPGSATRTIEFHQGSAEGKRLLEILERHGSRPFGDLSVDAFRSAWRRARKKLNLADSETWCLHALRHAFASRLKAHLSAEMVRQYGRRWREKPELIEKWRERVAGFLGHSALASTKLYG
ncbi:MAG: hypothetical protein EOM12_12425 [Verrucomicrobiae bacterium]|nr:hypothetical protein [Verrucomicrobiae bacterium]